MASRYTDYYMQQVGKGQSDIGYLYRGGSTLQRGRGVGSFFANVLRYITPAFKSGFNMLTDQALKSTSAIAKEIGAGGDKPLKQILKEQGKVALGNLASTGAEKIRKKMQTGSGIMGIKRKVKRKRGQSKKVIRQIGGVRKRKYKRKTKKSTLTTTKKRKKSGRKSGKTRKRKSSTRTIDIFNN